MGARDAQADAPAEHDSVDALVEATHDSPAPSRRRHRLAAVIASALGGLALAGGGIAAGIVHLSANERFDAAADELDESVERAAAADDALSATLTAVHAEIDLAGKISQAATPALVGQAADETLETMVTAASGSVDAAATLLARAEPKHDPAKPLWPWELHDEASVLESRADQTDASTRLVETTEDALADASADLGEAVSDLYASVAPAAAGLEEASVSAEADVVLDFREAAGAASAQSEIADAALIALQDYARQAEALRASGEAEAAEKAGPLYERRLEVEAFARSIAGGVVLDFDWAPVVAGVGGANALGGTAEWDPDRGGTATLTFSDSVAQWWPDEVAQAVVAHEVGHAISAKCVGMYDQTRRSTREEWATAWAISMGHTSYGNGTQAYGPPRQEIVDLAATCR
ncbi:hypothetical protein AB1K54_03980 [Microbacterium sp. BWT-B31]|uniref:hypothetical protein n=1 Tax=Microbacterium sp. BWT-B31 TaxID=3232072 RepID=UPI0035277DFE